MSISSISSHVHLPPASGPKPAAAPPAPPPAAAPTASGKGLLNIKARR